jgi:hypothetical protein
VRQAVSGARLHLLRLCREGLLRRHVSVLTRLERLSLRRFGLLLLPLLLALLALFTAPLPVFRIGGGR